MTYRAWRSPRVVVGRSYRFSPELTLTVDSVDEVPPSSISDSDALEAGFDTRELLLAELRRRGRGESGREDSVYRVRFRLVPGKGDQRLEVPLGEIATRLSQMDRLSRKGPWTGAVLRLIAANPKVAARKLAALLRQETLPFKADVRKLKRLGLTVSFEVGYELTALGRDYLALIDGPPQH